MTSVPKNIWMTGKVPSKTVTLAEVAAAMNRIAPTHLAEEWDNVGLLSGQRSCRVKNVLFAIDLTSAVCDEAVRLGVDLLVVYHPPIFKPIKHLCISGDEPPALAVALASYGIWIYSPHSALDTAEGGTNDVLAKRLGAVVTGSFSHYPAVGEFLKLVSFVPESHIEQVADAVFAVGAGHIGQKAKYTRCSFRSAGTGTFQGDESSNPAVGVAGCYEKVPEIRFETILPADLAGEVVNALRHSHPYEEPAFDLLKMATPPEQVGLGRYAELSGTETLAALAARAKKELGVSVASIVGNPKQKIRRLALVAGAAGRLPLDNAKNPYDCLITGELKHHEMLAYQAAGVGVVLLGHSETERPVLPVLAQRLKKELPILAVTVSKSDRGPARAV
ncbi:MAG: Nif3-like dinuclear metal center hexameric protein [Phycisphaerales bacterium]|nr:Nif3-like dinuclear metal center hexameric protein [Phycisphaerales bacterium]